jgi:hypothetical protein
MMRAFQLLAILMCGAYLASQSPWQISAEQQPITTQPIGAYQKTLVADLEGDGFPDIVIYGGPSTGIPLYLIRNHGPSGYGAQEQILPGNLGPFRKVIAADVDRDGDLDLLVLFGDSSGASGPGFINRLLINDGTGHFTDQTPQRWPTGPYSTMDAIVLDVNHDGWPDIVECNIGQHRLFLGQPNGVFVDATNNLPGNSTYGWQLAAGDIDGDGSPDLLIVGGLFGSAGGRDWLWLNDGQGHFRDESWRIPPRPNDFAVALGDIDGDGDVDLFLGVQMTFQIGALPHSQVLRNNGSGLFAVDPTALPPQGLYDFHSDARLVDLDGDGYRDLVMESQVAYGGTLFFNDGSGHFLPGWNRLPPVPTSCFGTPVVVPADMDADGDIDLVAISVQCAQRIYVFHSLRRHLTAAVSPRLGQPFQVDLNGQVSGIGVLGIALGNQFLSLPPIGTLQLDLTHYALFGPTALDTAGHASLALPIPQVPDLAGINLYLQGFVTSAPWSLMMFTNALREIIGP